MTPALKVETLGQLLDKEMPPRAELITPWLKAGESALVYAPTGVGKSLFTLTAALAVAGSGRFLGWTAKTPRRVLLVDGEMPRGRPDRALPGAIAHGGRPG